MILVIEGSCRVTATMSSLRNGPALVLSRPSDDDWGVVAGSYEVEEALVSRDEQQQAFPWIVLSESLRNGVLIGWPRNVLLYWADLHPRISLEEQEVVQLSLVI